MGLLFRIRHEVGIARRGVPFLLAPAPRGGGIRGAYVTIYDIASIPLGFAEPILA
ncbi:hypothetical protein Rhsp01_09390 [Rhizobium sp. NBRC 114257]|uniref:Uncharacterized protein n=1 Tax=Rhizobium dioscoreae TaxID=2653122 RepID=A0ABQ0YXE3_9HYPH|nr:hypothetical protein RsS93_03840 [Rhizobium dioscoreae]GLU79763.1 hypothetical protein Rhsp01_09390 [Rhizobium sp. NBRC 114257]